MIDLSAGPVPGSSPDAAPAAESPRTERRHRADTDRIVRRSARGSASRPAASIPRQLGFDTDGDEIGRFGFTYVLCRHDDRWTIAVAVAHHVDPPAAREARGGEGEGTNGAKCIDNQHMCRYFFDPGVARALGGRLREPLDASERGFLLETWVLHELRAAIAYGNLGGRLFFWRTPSGSEVDFVWSRGPRAVGVDVKAARAWRPDDGTALKGLVSAGVLTSGHGVYAGPRELRDGPIRVWPLHRFFDRLAAGDILD